MIPFFLMAVAFAVAAILLIGLMGRYADRGLKLQQADETIAELKENLDKVLQEQERLRTRVENLEAIVTTEAWDALHEEMSMEPPPDALSDEEKAALLARRQRST